MEIILHVGPHKTGSTALQRMFTALRDDLASQDMIYPRIGVTETGHHALVEQLRGRDAGVDLAALVNEVALARKMLLSSENIALAERDALKRLQDLFPSAQFRVIYYLRRLADLWPSHWQELVKHGQTLGFADYLAEAAMGHPENGANALNQIDQLTRLTSVFGPVEIIGYDALAAAGTEIGRHMLGEVLDLAGIEAGAPLANCSLKHWQVEILRLLNALLREAGQDANHALREALLYRLRTAPPNWLIAFREAVDAAPGLLIDSEGPLISVLQHHLVQTFGTMIRGDRLASVNAYFAPITRTVPRFEVPVLLSHDLRAKAEAFLRAVADS
ncbi:MAG: hypothetical protein ABIO62_17315 [Paracoccaceae bacterium]